MWVEQTEWPYCGYKIGVSPALLDTDSRCLSKPSDS